MEKRAIIAKLIPSYKQLVQEMEANGAHGADERLADQLSATRQVLQEAERIHSWPFDTGIVTRLAAVLFSVSAILVSAYLRDVFHF